MTRWMLLFPAVLVLIGVVYLKERASRRAAPQQPAPLSAREKVQARLRAAQKDLASIEARHLRRVHDFFDQKKARARAFGEAALSWSGKLALLKGKVLGDDSHQDFLRRAFEEHLFGEKDLNDLLHGVVTAFASEVEGRESALLVAIRADLSEDELPALKGLTFLGSDQEFRAAFRQAVDAAGPVVVNDLGVVVGQFGISLVGADLASPVVARVLGAVAARLGISGGILGTGAASGVTTLGLGVVIGIIIDWVVDWLFRQAGYDPAGTVAAETNTHLDRLRGAILGGQGLERELREMRQARERAWDAALLGMIPEGGAR